LLLILSKIFVRTHHWCWDFLCRKAFKLLILFLYMLLAYLSLVFFLNFSIFFLRICQFYSNYLTHRNKIVHSFPLSVMLVVMTPLLFLIIIIVLPHFLTCLIYLKIYQLCWSLQRINFWFIFSIDFQFSTSLISALIFMISFLLFALVFLLSILK
jgi:hypothetical protein